MAARPMRVCFFNRSYWPDTGATGQLLTELAEDLAGVHGFDVTVVTGYPAGVNGAGALPARERRHGVTIVRAAGTTLPPRRFAARASNYITYFLMATAAALRLPRQDVVVALTDPPIVGLAALAARRRGTAFVFWCQDVFPEVAALLDDFRSPVVDGLLDRLNRRLLARADRVVALGDTMARHLVEAKGADRGRLTVIPNWADTSAITPAARDNEFARQHGLVGRTVVLHAGNIGLSQNLEVVVAAADRLRDRPDLLFLFIGDGNRRPALEAAAAARALTNVRFLPFQPRDQMRWTYASADLCLVSLKPGLAGYIVPSKLYPILAAGRPYVAAVDASSEVAAVTTARACGLLAAPGDADDLARQVVRLADDAGLRAAMGARAREASADFDRRRQVAAHARVLTEVAAPPC